MTQTVLKVTAEASSQDGPRLPRGKHTRKKVAAVATAAAVFAIGISATPAGASSYQAQSGWKCAVAIPAAEALVAATKLTLQAATREVPRAEKRLETARASLVRAQAAASAAKSAAAANPTNTALADAAKTAATAASAREAAVNSASAVLKAAKTAIPAASNAAKKAQKKLTELKASCA